jgi:hypothetical protein
VTGADLELTANGRRLRFPAVWLRDNCPCTECQDPGSGQKLRDITEIPNDLGVAASENAGESVLVTFAPGGHRSTFSRFWTRRPPCSCCTACVPQRRGIVKGEWGGGWEVGVILA